MPSFFAEEARKEALVREQERACIAWDDAHPEPLPAPTQPVVVRDGDLLLIGRQGAIDPKGYEELSRRFDHPIASDEYDPEDRRLSQELRTEGFAGWPA